jgi:hypothetical protein
MMKNLETNYFQANMKMQCFLKSSFKNFNENVLKLLKLQVMVEKFELPTKKLAIHLS